ncbi:MAG: glycosyltransferase family 2 protein [Opitutaceae bacterium]
MLKLFLMTKNDNQFIEDWILYHGHLFGYDNLHILDGSDREEIFEVYAKFQPLGLQVHRSKSGLEDLAAELTELMHRHKGTNNFLIKLDTDEFLACAPPIHFKPRTSLGRWMLRRYGDLGPFSSRRLARLLQHGLNFKVRNTQLSNRNIRELLAALPITGQRYKASLTTWCRPQRQRVERPCHTLTEFTPVFFSHFKSFFHSASFIAVDLGGHEGETSNDVGVIDTGLAVIHYHMTSVEDAVDRAMRVLFSHGYIDETDGRAEMIRKLEALDARRSVTSGHKVRLCLEHLRALDQGKAVDLASICQFSSIRMQSFGSRNQRLVQQTLAEIRAKQDAELSRHRS